MNGWLGFSEACGFFDGCGILEDRGFFSTGRIITWCVLLVIAGVAVPALRHGPAAEWLGGLTGIAKVARKAESVSGVRDTAREVATRSRMRGIVAELKLWTDKYGIPRDNQLTEAVGRSTATDAWGRPIQFAAPLRNNNGWLRSSGPDGKQSEDDIYLPVSYQDLTGTP